LQSAFFEEEVGFYFATLRRIHWSRKSDCASELLSDGEDGVGKEGKWSAFV
jgi:hypothetical protein